MSQTVTTEEAMLEMIRVAKMREEPMTTPYRETDSIILQMRAEIEAMKANVAALQEVVKPKETEISQHERQRSDFAEAMGLIEQARSKVAAYKFAARQDVYATIKHLDDAYNILAESME